MCKNILILSASPRKKGNSDLLCDEFVRGAADAGHNAEKIFLADRKIGYCIGCDRCKKDEGVCFRHDDMEEILDRMIHADVIVLATPVYFYTMAAQLKTLIDRTVARYTEIANKEFYFLATAADSDQQDLERTFEGLRGFTACLPGAVEKGVLYGTGVWMKGDVTSTPAMHRAYEMGKNA